MSIKSKQYTIRGDKFIELMKRQQEADRLRPKATEWIEAIGMPNRTFFDNLEKEEVKK